MATKIQLRRGTAAQWSSANPLLADGELGLETDTGKFKFGNGTQVWNLLAYFTAPTAPVEAFKIDAVYISFSPTNPATSLGYGTWVAVGTGRMLVGFDAGDPDFNTVGATGGAKTVTLTEAQIPSHTHVQNSHNHTQDAHTHTQNSHNHTQDAHTHTQNSHTHVQDSHNHTQNSFAPRIINSGTAGTVGVQGASAASNANASNSATTATNQATTATNQSATATNQNATATNQSATAVNQNATATNQAATATNQTTGGGQAHSNLPPYVVVYMFRRTA